MTQQSGLGGSASRGGNQSEKKVSANSNNNSGNFK